MNCYFHGYFDEKGVVGNSLTDEPLSVMFLKVTLTATIVSGAFSAVNEMNETIQDNKSNCKDFIIKQRETSIRSLNDNVELCNDRFFFTGVDFKILSKQNKKPTKANTCIKFSLIDVNFC